MGSFFKEVAGGASVCNSHIFIEDLGYVLVVINLSILEIIGVNDSVMTSS